MKHSYNTKETYNGFSGMDITLIWPEHDFEAGVINAITWDEDRDMVPIYTMGDEPFGPKRTTITGELILDSIEYDKIYTQLPVFDIQLLAQNENGVKSRCILHGIEFVSDDKKVDLITLEDHVNEKTPEKLAFKAKAIERWRPV